MIQLKRLSVLVFSLVFYSAMGQVQWSSIANSDSFRVTKGVAVGVSNRGYILTGDTGKTGFIKFWDRVWQHDPATNSWVQKKMFSGKPRVSASSFVIGTKGYVCLGINDSIIWDSIYFINQYDTVYRDIPIKVWKGRPTKDLWEYDAATDTWTQKADFPGVARAAASAFVINGKAYVGCGVDSAGNMLKDFYEYDPSNDTWKRVADFGGKERSNASAFAGLNTTTSTPVPYGFVGSGRDKTPNTYFNDWYRYDPTGNTWTKVRDLPAERPQQDAAAFGYGYLGYLTTGFNWFYHKFTWQYNINANTWIAETQFPAERRSSTVFWQLGNRCFVGGGNADTVPSFNNYRFFRIDTSDIRITQNPDSVCTGSAFNVKFKSTQSSYLTGNQFRVQLSNRFGEFDETIPTGTIIGTLASLVDSGTINCLINPNANPRITFTDTNDYRIRIVSTSPYKFGGAINQTLVVMPKVIIDAVIMQTGDTACTGAEANLKVNGTWSGETSKFKIQWRKGNANLTDDGVRIFGANDTVLRILDIASSDAGNYTVIITGDCSGDTSNIAKLNVVSVPKPTITKQPLDIIACEDDSIGFKVGATGRSLNFTWFRANLRDADSGYLIWDTVESSFFISGEKTDVLRIKQAFVEDTGYYFAKVYENCGTFRYTDTVSFTFSRQVRVIDISPRDTFVLENESVNFKVYAQGDSLKYRWKFEDTYLADGPRIFGSQTDSMTIFPVDFQDLGFYTVEVDGLCGNEISPIGLLDVGIVPNFRAHPRDSTKLCAGEYLELSVIADGVNLSYQWLKNGLPMSNGGNISGADQRILKISPVTTADAGAYRCRVDAGTIASVTSNIGIVEVYAIPAKPGINAIGISLLESTVDGQTFQWYLNNIFQPQFNTKIINTDLEGEYKVRVINNNCVGPTSDPFLFTIVVSVNTPTSVAQISVFPNPNNGRFNVKVESQQSFNSLTFEVLDLSGRRVGVISNLDAGVNDIDVSGIAQGLYIGRVQMDGSYYDVKIRIQ